MPLTNCLNNIRNFINGPQKDETCGLFQITVAAFEEKSGLNCGKCFAELLKRNKLFSVNFYNEQFPRGFLNLQGRFFYDFIQTGNKILNSTHADILIWGYEENGKIRLNFQVQNQYLLAENSFLSLLDGLYIPLNFFTNTANFSESVLLLIYGIIIAAINPITLNQQKHKPALLSDVIHLLSQDTSPKEVSREFMPFIMNMLGKIYLCESLEKLSASDVEIIGKLFDDALKNTQYRSQPLNRSCSYNNMGILYETAFQKNHLLLYLKSAISNYKKALDNLNRTYPYDYALIACRLARLYFEYWKQTADLQALRDAVALLRDAEKVYTKELFPLSWGYLQGLLGYYLTSLGMNTSSNEIMMLSINAYRLQQELYEQHTYPVEWAKIQEEIGNIYYLLGKQNNDDNFMYEARNYFNSALEIYTQLHAKNDISAVQTRLAKVQNYID